MSRTRHPPPNRTVDGVLDLIDKQERAKERCGRCGKSRFGVLRLDRASGRMQTRAEAELCECEPMRTVCAWCEEVLEDGPADGPVSHGLCRACREREFPQTVTPTGSDAA